MNLTTRQFWRAAWQYLNQPVGKKHGSKSIWKPSMFWYLYQVKFLEACWCKASTIPNHGSRGHDEYRAGN